MTGKFWLGSILLTLLLILGLVVAAGMDRTHLPIATDLEKAAEISLTGDFTAANDLAQKAKAQWEKHWHATATVADHEPMEDIDGLFSQMEIYRKNENREEFSAYCSRLSILIEAVSEAQRLNWWNLL